MGAILPLGVGACDGEDVPAKPDPVEIREAIVTIVELCSGRPIASPTPDVTSETDALIRNFRAGPDEPVDLPKLEPDTPREALAAGADFLDECSPDDAERAHGAMSETP